MDMSVPEPVRHTAARAAAAAIAAARSAGGVQVLCFSAAGSTYAMGIAAIKEIIEYGTLTTIPLMPAFIRGVINLRGAVVPVVDLAARFGRAQSPIGKRTCIVIVEVSENDLRHDIGLLVDAVSEVIEIPGSEIEPPPSFGARIRADFIQGMGKVAGRFVIILNIVRVLSVDEIALLAQVASAEASSGAA